LRLKSSEYTFAMAVLRHGKAPEQITVLQKMV